jgi:hypothetical protein
MARGSGQDHPIHSGPSSHAGQQRRVCLLTIDVRAPSGRRQERAPRALHHVVHDKDDLFSHSNRVARATGPCVAGIDAGSRHVTSFPLLTSHCATVI